MLNHHHQHHHQMDKYPRDLLQRFVLPSGGGGGGGTSGNNINPQQQQDHHHHQQQRQQNQVAEQHDESEEEEEDQDAELELNLGLSLGGRFGVDKNAAKKKLTRSSSVIGTMPLPRDDRPPEQQPPQPPAAYHAGLMRSSSLPTETEEEWRKRKELQTLRRMEAKRRRSEKQRVARSERESTAGATAATAGAGSGINLEEAEGASATTGLNRVGSLGSQQPFGSANWGVGARQVVLSDVLGRGKVGAGSGGGGGGGFQGLFAQPSSQGSADSQGGSSSSLSEFESKPFLGLSGCGEVRSPVSNPSLQERSSQDAGGLLGTKTNENASRASKAEVEVNRSKKPNPAQNKGREIGTNSMEDMPCVFTKGDGPNGRRIEGILYRYGKGEEVRIMCVCHGDFLSPAEFVKHAGGGDVAHPLRHIVVNPSATPFL